jgi:hypothetical protein
MAVQTRFSRVEEFVAELVQDHGFVEDLIVRLTCQYMPTEISFVKDMYVVAGFLAHNKLVYLRQRCGQVMAHEVQGSEHNEQTRARAEQIATQIREQVTALRLLLRAGVFASVERGSQGA